MTWIAEFPLTWIMPDGRRTPGFIAVGEPELVPDRDGDAVCPVALDGLQEVTRINGVGKFHALLQGIHFLELRIRDEVEARGLRVVIPGYDDEPESDTASLLRMFKPFVLSWPAPDPEPATDPEPDPDPDPPTR